MQSKPDILLLLGYVALLVYGSLFPWSGWVQPDYQAWQQALLFRSSKSDIVLNFLVYVPVGLLVVRGLARQVRWIFLLLLALMAGLVLSLAMELSQLFLPSRVSSMMDVSMNSLGAFVGGLLGHVFFSSVHTAEIWAACKPGWLQRDRFTSYALGVVSLWVLSQLTPLVPSPAWSNIKHGLKPAWFALHDPSLFQPDRAAVYVLYVLGLCIVLMLVSLHRGKALLFAACLITAVLLLKVPVMGRQLSLEAGLGCMLALVLAFCLRNSSAGWLIGTAFIAVSLGFILQQFTPGAGEQAWSSFNWLPFKGYMSGHPMELAKILAKIWPFTVLGFLTLKLGLGPWQMLAAGLFLAALVFCSEWLQGFLPGRYPDITDVILPMLGWSSAVVYPLR